MGSFIELGVILVVSYFCQFTDLTSFLCFRNKDKLIKLWVFLEVKNVVTNFLNPLNI